MTVGFFAALAVAPAALASHPSWFLERPANLDGDRGVERIAATYDVSSDHKVERAEIAAIDKCGGRDRKHELAPPGRSIDREGIRGDRALGRPGVLFSMAYRDGHSIARVVRLRAPSRDACPTPVALFSYSSENPPFRPPAGYTIRFVRVEPSDYSQRYPGKELLLTEEYAGRQLNPVRTVRRTYFRYSQVKGRYVAYRTKVSPAR